MPEIDPRHSRPLDVHRWSEHPEAKALTDEIWADPYFDGLRERAKSKGGVKPKRRFKEQLRVLVLDLFVAWKADPTLSIGVAMGVGEWDTNSRYNALHLSKIIPSLVARLAEMDLIELSRGSYAGPGAKGNRTTRIQASEKLAARFAGTEFSIDDLEPVEGRETVILRGMGKKPISYTDTDQTRRWRSVLEAYNERLRRSFIDIPSLDEPFVERVFETGLRAGQTQRIPIGPNNMHIHRVFSRGRWDLNGRFYGGWWQQLSKDMRRQIYIDDQPTVELDYRGLHVALLSVEQGVTIEGDPYLLPDGILEGIGPDEQRRYVKHLVLTGINAKNKKSAFQAFRDHFSGADRGHSLTNVQLQLLLDAFLETHPHLREQLFADQGIRLMFVDSQIAGSVLAYCIAHDIPVLMVHDSFIVPERHGHNVSQTLVGAAFYRIKADLEISVTEGVRFLHPDYDEVLPGDLEKTPGYLRRLDKFRNPPPSPLDIY